MGSRLLWSIFQFTPLREGRQTYFALTNSTATFQFTPLREGRLPGNPAYMDSSYFNSRPSARGDAIRRMMELRMSDFNSRPSARGDVHRNFVLHSSLYFNSRPSARGDSPCSLCWMVDKISIHAPPRGATRMPTSGKNGLKNFNSRPSARGDKRGRKEGKHMLFQFTPLREGRRLHDDELFFFRFISIHAPPRGATRRQAVG